MDFKKEIKLKDLLPKRGSKPSTRRACRRGQAGEGEDGAVSFARKAKAEPRASSRRQPKRGKPKKPKTASPRRS